MRQAELKIISAICRKMDADMIEQIIKCTIPIYTRKHPNPKSGQPDCPNTKRDKEHFRKIMRVKLVAAKTEEERQIVIDHYKSKWSE